MHSSSDIPTKEPTVIVAGTTVKWTKDLSAHYPASQGWSLVYSLRLQTGSGTGDDALDLTAAADGDAFSITIPSTDTVKTAGLWCWASYIQKDTERYRIDEGTFSLEPDLSAISSTFDGRSHAKTVLDAIEAVIEGRASKDQQSYAIGGRQLARTPIVDLLLLRDRYKAEYEREVAKDRIEKGLGSGSKILMRF